MFFLMSNNPPDTPENLPSGAERTTKGIPSVAQTPSNKEIKSIASNPRPSFFRRSLVLGGVSVGLCLPLVLIWLTIAGRSQRAEEAQREVRSSWGGDSFLAGPFLVVPYQTQVAGPGDGGWLGPSDQRRIPSSPPVVAWWFSCRPSPL